MARVGVAGLAGIYFTHEGRDVGLFPRYGDSRLWCSSEALYFANTLPPVSLNFTYLQVPEPIAQAP
jgi:hypothetical protein